MLQICDILFIAGIEWGTATEPPLHQRANQRARVAKLGRWETFRCIGARQLYRNLSLLAWLVSTVGLQDAISGESCPVLRVPEVDSRSNLRIGAASCGQAV